MIQCDAAFQNSSPFQTVFHILSILFCQGQEESKLRGHDLVLSYYHSMNLFPAILWGFFCIFRQLPIRGSPYFNLQYYFLLSIMHGWVKRSATWILAPRLIHHVYTEENFCFQRALNSPLGCGLCFSSKSSVILQVVPIRYLVRPSFL